MVENSLLRAVGKISFALYLVHGPILWTIGDRVYAAVGRPRPNSEEFCPGWTNVWQLTDWGPFGLEINFLLANAVLFVLTVWTARIATKLFDEPGGKFARWLFNPKRYETL